MKNKTIKVSLPLKKIIYFILVAGALIFFARLIVSRSNTTQNAQEKQKEFVLPADSGVSDSGFEGKITNFAALNAKASIDARGKIDGASSLKISFSDQQVASVKVPSYINEITEGDFYRLSFWAKDDLKKDKQITLRISEKEKNQDLGNFSMNKSGDAEYFEFNFQAENSAQDLILTSNDGVADNVWIDDVLVEKIKVNSPEELKDLKPTIFGNTTWKNVDQYQNNSNGGSGVFFSRPAKKMGQIFQPEHNFISGAAFKILRHGTGGTGAYQAQLREFNESLGVISDEIIASAPVDQTPNSEIADAIKNKERQMREEFVANEQGIKDGTVPNDKTEDQYPATFTQDQIDAAKAAKRAVKLEIDVRNMKESFNDIEEIYIPLAAKLDTNKKYWIGLDNAGVVVDQNNYISIVSAAEKNNNTESDGADIKADIKKEENPNAKKENDTAKKEDAKPAGAGGFISEVPGTWTNSPALWFETFYPSHYSFDDSEILSGATISDMGEGKMIYRYHFAPNDLSSLSGFSGRKIYDMLDGKYSDVDIYGNYKLSDDDFAVYKFNTIYSASKIIVRGADFHQSLALEISTDGENWEEIYSDNPAASNQSIDPIVFNPEKKTNAFYLKIKPNGNDCVFYGLSVEAELEK